MEEKEKNLMERALPDLTHEDMSWNDMTAFSDGTSTEKNRAFCVLRVFASFDRYHHQFALTHHDWLVVMTLSLGSSVCFNVKFHVLDRFFFAPTVF
jgi:hypothetical protein